MQPCKNGDEPYYRDASPNSECSLIVCCHLWHALPISKVISTVPT